MLPPNQKQPILTAFFLVLVGVCAALHVWKLPPALPSLQRELNLNLVESGFLLSSVQFAGMTLGLITGLFAERIGLRRCILIGLAILSLASLNTTFFHSKTMFLLSRAIEGCGFLMVVLPVPALIKRLVPADALSRIMGLWGSYMPAGAVIILLGGSWLISISSWRTLWLLLASVTLLMFLFALVLIPQDKAEYKVKRVSIISMIATTLGAKSVWLVALIFGVYAAQWSAVIGFLPTIYTNANISGPTAGFLTALIAGSNIIGNVMAGRLLYKAVSAPVLMTIGFITMIITAFVAFGLGLGATAQFFAVLLLSIVGGLIPATCFVLAVSFAPTPQTTSSTVGWVQQCSAMGQFVGAPVVAWVVSLFGGWQWAWVATMAFALCGLVMVFLLSRTTSIPAN